ncbi:MAG: TMEM175 family protein [Daejeonella sp.]
MNKNRLEAFSDGVLAIVITIMVLEFKVPHSADLNDLIPVVPTFLSYVLSFIYIGIYWNNHHHLLNASEKVTGKILWANLHLLFWLSMIPFVTAWMGENHFASTPVGLYGFVLMMAGVAYYILEQSLVIHHGKNSLLSKAVGNDKKGITSVILYMLAIVISYYNQWVSGAIYIFVALMWLIPDARIEKAVEKEEKLPEDRDVTRN